MPSTLRMDKKWTLAEASTLISTLQTHLRPLGYHVTLGGGVLNRGYSVKDLDLYFLPLDSSDYPAKPDALVTFLTRTWGKAYDFSKRPPILETRAGRAARLAQSYPDLPGSPYVWKRKFMMGDMRIDVFIIGAKGASAALAADAGASDEPTQQASAMPSGIAPILTADIETTTTPFVDSFTEWATRSISPTRAREWTMPVSTEAERLFNQGVDIFMDLPPRRRNIEDSEAGE